MKKLILVVLALLLSTPAFAAPEKYTFDAAHTQVIFSVSHLGFSFSHGKFKEIHGSFMFDEENVETSSVDVSIPMASIDMGTPEWDAHLRNADFFNVEKFPAMTFKSTKAEKTGEKTGKLTGDLTLLGVTKPVMLDVTFNSSGIHPYSKNKIAGFSATGSLKRSDFGMNYGLPNVGDEVNIIIQVEGVLQETTTP